MFPSIEIGIFTIPSYILLVGIGFSVGAFLADRFSCSFEITKKDSFYLVLAAEIGVIIGGKILFLLTNLSRLNCWFIRYRLMIFAKTGFVFYGGLIGTVIAVLIFSKIRKININNSLSLVLFLTPIVHGFGRIGCLLAGCCFGYEYDGLFSVINKGVNRFPVQLLEAILDFLLFTILYFFRKQSKKNINVISGYFVGYGIIRIITEYFRADIHRGFIFGISISTWISFVRIIGGFILILKDRILFKKSNSI